MSVGWDMEKNFWPRTKYVAAQGASFLNIRSPTKSERKIEQMNWWIETGPAQKVEM